MSDPTQKRNLGGLISVFLLVIIGLALTPTVQEQVTGVTGTGGNNLTGAAAAIAGLIPLFWVILLLSVAAAAVVVWLRSGG